MRNEKRVCVVIGRLLFKSQSTNFAHHIKPFVALKKAARASVENTITAKPFHHNEFSFSAEIKLRH